MQKIGHDPSSHINFFGHYPFLVKGSCPVTVGWVARSIVAKFHRHVGKIQNTPSFLCEILKRYDFDESFGVGNKNTKHLQSNP